MTYYSDRLAAYRITEADNTFLAEAESGEGRTCQFQFFTETERGDISINYLTPSGMVESYPHGHNQTRRFSRLRYANPELHTNADGKPMKYRQDRGTETIPFSTPTVINAFRRRDELHTLFVVEGEFKAFALHMQGLPAMGIGGVQNFRDAQKTKLHPSITDVISRCKVRNIVLIYDRDCIEAQWSEGKDMAERPLMFYNALNTFNELLKPYDVQLYFAHVSPGCPQKGIDDALIAPDADTGGIVRELLSFTNGMPDRRYVLTYQVTGISSYKIMKIFGLDSVDSFYAMHERELLNREFRFRNNDYYIEDGKPVVAWMAKTREYVRIGTDYYHLVTGFYGKKGHEVREVNLMPWKQGTIKADFGAKFLAQVRKYDGFANLPENDPDRYSRCVVVEKDGYCSSLYNIYSPVSHRPAEGDWRNINRLLHHIFDYKNCAGVSMYEMALDYLQLIYQHPAQHLPILCLVSEEQATGKTTFLELLKAIFNENMRILDSKRLSGQFNSHWAGKLIVATDEAFLNTDKEEIGNTLKMIATNETVPMEGKGVNATEVFNFAKLIMCSNQEKSFARIEAEDTRYWVVKVQSIPKDERDPHLKEKMFAEIPAFLFFLQNRAMYYPETTRLWFEPDDYDTPAHRAVQERTELGLVKHVKDVVRQQFFMQHTDKIHISLAALFERVSWQYKFADKQKISEYMHDRGLSPGNATNFVVASGYDDADRQWHKDRCYTLLAKDWLSEHELAELAQQEDNAAAGPADEF